MIVISELTSFMPSPSHTVLTPLRRVHHCYFTEQRLHDQYRIQESRTWKASTWSRAITCCIYVYVWHSVTNCINEITAAVIPGFYAAIGTPVGLSRIQDQELGPCYSRHTVYHCGLPATALAVTSSMLLLIIGYFVLYCFFLLQAMRQLRASPTLDFKLANTVVRIQVSITFLS